jgi:hypothetical protein
MVSPAMSVSRLAARAVALALLALIAIVPASARAQDADALIKQGVELRRAGNDQAALEQFRRAYDLAPTPRTLAQLGLAEQALGRWADGEAHLGRALDATQDPWIAKYRDTLEASRAEIAKHLGSLVVSGGPDGAELRVDDRAVGTLPFAQPLRLIVGAHALEVTAGGRVLDARAVSIVSGLTAREDFSAPSSKAPASGDADVSAESAPPPSASGRRAAGWIAAGGAAALAATGIAFLLVGDHDVNDWNNLCRGTMPPMMCGGLRNDVDRDRTIGAVSLIAAGAVGVTAAVLFLTSSERTSADRRVACLPDLGARGAACALRF